MHDAFVGKCYLPKQNEVSPVLLASPPTKEMAKEALLLCMDKNKDKKFVLLC